MDERPLEFDDAGAAAAFGSLSDELRLAILGALWRRRATLSFSELQAAVGAADSGRFNYHLNKLTDHFVRKTDDGYTLRPAGVYVIDTVAAGVFTAEPTTDAVGLGVDCPDCGAELFAQYRDGQFSVECHACSVVVNHVPFPPRGVQTRTMTDLLSAYSNHVRRQFHGAAIGDCPYCAGRMDTTVAASDDPDWYLSLPAVSECRDCGGIVGSTVGLRLLDHPTVSAFLHNRGIDVAKRHFWEFEFCLSDDGTTLVAEDPLRVEQCVAADDDELWLLLGDGFEIIEETHVERRS